VGFRVHLCERRLARSCCARRHGFQARQAAHGRARERTRAGREGDRAFRGRARGAGSRRGRWASDAPHAPGSERDRQGVRGQEREAAVGQHAPDAPGHGRGGRGHRLPAAVRDVRGPLRACRGSGADRQAQGGRRPSAGRHPVRRRRDERVPPVVRLELGAARDAAAAGPGKPRVQGAGSEGLLRLLRDAIGRMAPAALVRLQPRVLALHRVEHELRGGPRRLRPAVGAGAMAAREPRR
jgi:hypothetical protein